MIIVKGSCIENVTYKGDANYRRMHGDLYWEYTHPTSEIIDYFESTVALLRTLKSEVQTGLTKERLESLKNEEGWLYTGKFGVIQVISK